jgi:hypothetical protein
VETSEQDEEEPEMKKELLSREHPAAATVF